MITATHITDDVGQPDSLAADVTTYEVTIRPRNPIDYRVYAPTTVQVFILRTAGEPFTFRRSDREAPFRSGEIVGFTEIPPGGGTQTFDKFSL